MRSASAIVPTGIARRWGGGRGQGWGTDPDLKFEQGWWMTTRSDRSASVSVTLMPFGFRRPLSVARSRECNHWRLSGRYRLLLWDKPEGLHGRVAAWQYVSNVRAVNVLLCSAEAYSTGYCRMHRCDGRTVNSKRVTSMMANALMSRSSLMRFTPNDSAGSRSASEMIETVEEEGLPLRLQRTMALTYDRNSYKSVRYFAEQLVLRNGDNRRRPGLRADLMRPGRAQSSVRCRMAQGKERHTQE